MKTDSYFLKLFSSGICLILKILWIGWDWNHYLTNKNSDTEWLVYNRSHKWLLAELNLHCPPEAHMQNHRGPPSLASIPQPPVGRLRLFQEKFSTEWQPISESKLKHYTTWRFREKYISMYFLSIYVIVANLSFINCSLMIASAMCLLGSATWPTYLIKHSSRCCCQGLCRCG